MSALGVYQAWETAEIAIDSTGDKATFTPSRPVNIIRVGVVGTTSYTHGSGAILKFDINASDGDGTYTRGDGDAGTVAVDSGFNAGLVNKSDATSRIQVNPGDQVIVQVSQAATAGDGVAFIEYEPQPNVATSSEVAENRLDNVTDV